HRRRLLVQDGSVRCSLGRLIEREPSGRHLVEYDPEGKQIGASVQGLAVNLFGRHVGDGAQRVACDGQLVIHKGGIVGASSGALVAATYFSEAKIKDLGLASLGDHDVRGFYVAVDDASSVGRVKGIGDFNCEPQQRIPGLASIIPPATAVLGALPPAQSTPQ